MLSDVFENGLLSGTNDLSDNTHLQPINNIIIASDLTTSMAKSPKTDEKMKLETPNIRRTQRRFVPALLNSAT